MLSENEARALLREAGDTVPVTAGTDLLETARRARRGRRAVIASAAAAVTIIVAGGTAVGMTGPNATGPAAPARPTAGPPSPTSPTTAPSDGTTPPSGGPRLVGVPILVEYPEEEAMQRVADWGLRAVVRRAPSCEPEGTVIATDPRVGEHVPAGSTVTLTIAAEGLAGPDCPVAHTVPRHHRDIARLFATFAADPARNVAPFAPRVDLGLGDQLYSRIRESEVSDPSAWELCSSYAERSCPMSALEELSAWDGEQVLSYGRPDNRCFAGEQPSALTGELPLRIEPKRPPDTDCNSYWSVDLYLNDVDQITEVVLRLGSP